MRAICGRHICQLRTDTSVSGQLADVSMHSAVAGFIALRQFDELSDVLTKDGSSRATVHIKAEGVRNWELMRLLIENWEEIDRILGPAAWKFIRDWDLLVVGLAQAGKRSLALKVPADLQEEGRKNFHKDEELFDAIAVLEKGQEAFKEACIKLFERFVRAAGHHSIGWSYDEARVSIAAAHYLAEHHAGNAELGNRLEELAVLSHEPTGPVIALCRGWPNATALQNIWVQASEKRMRHARSACGLASWAESQCE